MEQAYYLCRSPEQQNKSVHRNQTGGEAAIEMVAETLRRMWAVNKHSTHAHDANSFLTNKNMTNDRQS